MVEKRFVTPDEAASRLAMNLFDELSKGYVSLAQFRGRIATEIERTAPEPLKREGRLRLRYIDQLISSAQDQLDRAVEEMRRMVPGTLLVTLGRKPHYLPGR